MIALALSAALHGALAATALLWPDKPVPLPVGPITVALVSEAPTAGEQTGQSAADSPDMGGPATAPAAAKPTPSAPSTNEPTPDTVPLAVQSGLDETEPSDKPVIEKTTPIDEPATPPQPPIRPRATGSPIPPPPVTAARSPLAPSIPPPPRRPASLALAAATPSPVVPKAAPMAPPPPKPDASTGSAALSSAVPAPADRTKRQAASGPPSASTTAACGNNAGQGQAAMSHALPGVPGARSGGAAIGPHFTMGSAANPRPRYPLSARRRGIEGRVVLRVFVGADGHVQSIDILHSSHHAVLDDAAVRALRRWRFEPARQAGLPVAGRVDIPVAFRLRD